MKNHSFWELCLILAVLMLTGCFKGHNATHFESASIVSDVTGECIDGTEIKNGRLVEELYILKQKAGINEPVSLKKFYDFNYINFGDGNAWIDRARNGRATIHISKYYYDNIASNDAVTAVFVHELGHLKRGHCSANFQYNSHFKEDKESLEAEADAFTLRLVGKKVFVDGFKHLARHTKERRDGPKYRFQRMKKYGHKF